MKQFDWNEEKNQQLKATRNVSFEDVITALENKQLLGELVGKGNYSHQKQYIVNINNYPYVVPYVEDDKTIFLKTIFPNRKLKHLLQGQDNEQT